MVGLMAQLIPEPYEIGKFSFNFFSLTSVVLLQTIKIYNSMP